MMFKSRAVMMMVAIVSILPFASISVSAATVHGLYTSTIDTSGIDSAGSVNDLLIFDFFYSTTDSPVDSSATYAKYSSLFGTVTIGSNLLTFSSGNLYLRNDDPTFFDSFYLSVDPFNNSTVVGTVYGHVLDYVEAWLGDTDKLMLTNLLLPSSLDTSLVDTYNQYICVEGIDDAVCKETANPYTLELTIVPEVPVPAALPLLAAGLGALGYTGWRRKRKAIA